MDDGSGNWLLNIDYNSALINPAEAFSSTIYVKFQAPSYLDTDISAPNDATFGVDLRINSETISTDSSTSKVGKTKIGRPHFQKLNILRKDTVNNIPNVGIMDTIDSKNNVFAILVNYDEKNLENVKITDVIPENTFLSDPKEYVPATGDPSIYNHFRIAKVTSWNEKTGGPGSFEYVTNNFINKISVDSKGFTINLGDIDEGYVIMYGQSVDESLSATEFGVRYNKATLSSDSEKTKEANVPIALPQNNFDQATLIKTVNQATISTNYGEISYNLKLKVNQGKLLAGTVVSDPLTDHMSYLETESFDTNYFSNPEYNTSTNTVSYTLLKDLEAGQEATIKFKTLYSNLNAEYGDIIHNKASFSYFGTNIFSNDATTMLDGSAYLYKTDDSSNPLEGAEFKILNSDNQTVISGLVSDEKGFINSGILAPGKYQFIEIKAPNGYQLDSSPIHFNVVAGQETPINLTKINHPSFFGNVVLKKVDGKSSVALQGAVFMLQDSNGNDLKVDLVSDSSGNIVVDELRPGQYQFVETKAPEGYKLDKTPQLFIINANSKESVKIIVTNDKKKDDDNSKLPSTGEKDGFMVLILGAIIVASLTIYYDIKIKRQ